MSVGVELPPSVEAYLDRADWGASPLEPKAVALPTSQFEGFVLHHTVFVLTDYDRDGFVNGDLDDMRRYTRVLQVARPDLGSEVPYSWVIFAGSTDDTCVIAEGRGKGRKGAHTAGLNSTRYAWAIAGNTDADRPITPGMVAGMRWLASVMLDDPEHAAPAIGHQQAPAYFQNGSNLNATGCPGSDGLRHLAELQPPYRSTDRPPAPSPAPPEDDVQVTKKIAQVNGMIYGVRYVDGQPDTKQWVQFYDAWWHDVWGADRNLIIDDGFQATLDRIQWYQGDAPSWADAPAQVDTAAIVRAVVDAIPPTQLPSLNADEIAGKVADEFKRRLGNG